MLVVTRPLVLALLLPAAAAASSWIPDGTSRPAAWVVATGTGILDRFSDDRPHPPASLAKLAAALAAGQADDGTWVTVSRRAATATGSRIGLRAGERVRYRDLVAAMLVASANDACLAAAEHATGGRPQRLVARMNRLAARLGMRDTHFADPCGFDRPGQRTSARDLLKLARAVLAEPHVSGIVGRSHVRLETASGRVLAAATTNALIDRYDGIVGIKTGYTQQAGPCLIAAARRGRDEVIVVALGARDRWPFAVAAFDEAFGQLSGMPVVRSHAAVGIPD